MPTTMRRFEPAVIERLFAQPYRFQFFQAVRLLELWLRRNGMAQQGAIGLLLRFQNSVLLTFPASQIEALVPEPSTLARDGAALTAALRQGQLKYIRITPAFMGFLGTAGALPAHYTERIAAWQLAHKDEGPRAFLDAFSNRALALFYAAWSKYRLALQYQLDGKDRFLPLLLALAGVGQEALQRRLADGAVLDESLAYFAAALRQRPASAVLIGQVLGDYFGLPVAVTQFIGGWYDMPPAQQSALGGGNATLGSTALLGARVWQRNLRLRLTLGPLAQRDFESFLPGAPAARALQRLLSMFTGLCLEYEVQLVLRAADVRAVQLDSQRSGGRLGWDTFLSPGAAPCDRDDVRYLLNALPSPTRSPA